MSDPRPIGEDDIEAFIDGRLDAQRAAAVMRHVQDDPAVAERVAAGRRIGEDLRAALAAKVAEPIPSRLRIASVAARRRIAWPRLGAVAAAVALMTLGGVAGWVGRDLAGPMRPASSRPDIAADAMTAHRVFAAEVAHPVEVTRAQEAHLVQWLSRRVGQALTAPDLAALGFRLMGGRLLPTEPGAAAQFMYDDAGGQRLTLYLRQRGGAETAFRFTEAGEIGSLSWIENGLGFVVAGRIGRERLTEAARAVYDSFEKAPAQRL